MQLRKGIFIELLLITFLNGCVWLNNTENTKIPSSLPKIKNQFQPITIWNHSVGSVYNECYSNLHPAWQDNRIFAANRHGLIKALDINSGKEIWSTNLSGHKNSFLYSQSAKLSGGVTVEDDRVYVGSELGKVFALNAQNGDVIWETTIAGEVMSTPVISDGVILIHTSNGMLQALNEVDGSINWVINFHMPLLTLRGESSPTTIFGTAIIGGDDGQVSAIIINQGQLIWQQQISKQNINTTTTNQLNDVRSTPVVVNGVVYAVAYNGNLVALELLSGQVIWSRKIGSINNIIVENSRIYLVDQNDHVIAVNTQNGVIIWRQSALLHRNLISPILYNGYIVTGDSYGYLYWINENNGQFVAQHKVDSAGLLSEPIVASNKLIVQAKNGIVYAITS